MDGFPQCCTWHFASLQSCFLTQRLPKDIKPTHPFKEYCVAVSEPTSHSIVFSLYPFSPLYFFCYSLSLLSSKTTSGDDFRDFRKVVHNKVSKKYRRKPQKMSYLDYSVTNGDTDSQEATQEEDTVQEGSG